MRPFLVIFLSVFVCFSCQQDDSYKERLADPAYIHESVLALEEVIVHDIFSPPVASRIYVYPSIAAYEVMAAFNPDYRSLAGQVRDLGATPNTDTEISVPLAALHAYLTTGKALVFSEPKIETFEEEFYKKLKDLNVPSRIYSSSLTYGKRVAEHILAWADKDYYKETRTYPKYNFTDDPAKWQPTPPSYMEGIEPSWNQIRPFVLDSAQQFVPAPPTEFSTSEDSRFYAETMEVYRAVKDASEEHIAIANFWDCNPYVSHQTGHVMYATKKITPGGHWIGIVGTACEKAGADFNQTLEAYALTSIAIADAFISCWDEKYRSNLIRPETVINKYIDEDWAPILQTPPFPEHTSGHSVVSGSAATALTHLFGDNFAFVDSTEVRYGLPARSFTSFRQAADEAAISRLYGGIHYMPAIEYGVEQGKKVGMLVIDRVRTDAE